MRTKAVRMYGKRDLRLEEFELPAMKDDEIVARVVSDSICMSSYKAAQQGAEHKRVPENIKTHPVIIGHEFCGEILEVGRKWQHRFSAGQKFSIQPALNYRGTLAAPGYSYSYIGGDAIRILIPNEVMECDCLLPYEGEGYFLASLAEPVSCVIGAFHASYHVRPGTYIHAMGIAEGGAMAILGGAGPMGQAAIDYAIHGDKRPALLVVTDIDERRLQRAGTLYPSEEAARYGVKLHYVNTASAPDGLAVLRELTGGSGFNDVFVFASVRKVVEQADQLLARDGCLNFFAGPADAAFGAELNFFNVHYAGTHVVGTSGGNSSDLQEALSLIGGARLHPASMVTHVGGLNTVIETTLHLPEIPGGKKLVYTNIELEFTALEELAHKGRRNPLFKELAEITERHCGVWSVEAESFLLTHALPITIRKG